MAEAWGRDRNARLTWSRQRKSWLSEPVSFFKIGVDLNGMSASEYLPLYQSFTDRTYIRNGRRFDRSEISQIIEKNICCSVILSGLIQLKSIPRTEYIVLPYNIRMPALWTPFRGWILSCQKGVAFHDHLCDMTQNCTTINKRQISIILHRL